MSHLRNYKNKSIYSPISDDSSPILSDEGSLSYDRRKMDKNHRKRADHRETSHRRHAEDRFGRSRERYDRSKGRHERSRDKHEKSRDRSGKVRSRHTDRHEHDKYSRRDHKRSDRSREKSKKEHKHKHKKRDKKKYRTPSKSSSKTSSDSDEDLRSSSFISEILKNKKAKNTEKILDEVRKAINNESKEDSASFTPPLKPEMPKTADKTDCDKDINEWETKKLLKSDEIKSKLDENGNVPVTSVPKNTQKSVDIQNATSNPVNHVKKKSILDLPMPPIIDLPRKPSTHQREKKIEKPVKSQQKSHAPDKIVNTSTANVPPTALLDSKQIEPIIAANFENSQLKKAIICHPPPQQLPQAEEMPMTSGCREHFKEMQKHLQKDLIFTPFDPKGTPPEFVKPSRPSIINKPDVFRSGLLNQPFESFKILEQVGKGSYGKVFKAINLKTKEKVAMKYIKVENETEGFPITCLREIKILRQLDHPNIIKLRDIVFRQEKNSTYLVFDYMNHDLLGLRLNNEMIFDEPNVFHIARQLLEGINYCHQRQIIHRDLKLSNILVNNAGQLKICDFGLSRMWTVNRPYTNKVISLWYRPIEILLGDEMYGPPVDIWSVGCIIYELFKRKPLFEFSDEITLVKGIFQLCGTTEYNMWPEAKLLPLYKTFKPNPRMRTLKTYMYPTLPPLAIDLVDQMLALNPAKRITAEDALKSNWITKMQSSIVTPLKLPKMDSLEMRARGLQ